MKLWLDDVRPAPPGWVWCKNANDCMILWAVFKNEVDEVSLDHDLGENVKTGYDVAKWVEREVVEEGFENFPVIHIHSANPVGRKNIEAALTSAARYSMMNGSGQPSEA